MPRKQLIFISGRFRSGTSMMWNIFNQLPQYCAYYEPLHPNLISHIKHVKPKQDHIGIDDYWQNYKELDDLDKYYSSEFGQHRMYLEKHEKWQKLEDYIRYLISQSKDKIPVLQFNRMDLRLNWLHNTFPNATIINIERNPFDLWASSRKHIKSDEQKNNESHPDAYDLMQWSVDLAKHFPMLIQGKNRSSYYRHYFVWKLAHHLAQSTSDICFSLENHFINSQSGIQTLAKKLMWDEESIKIAQKLVKTPQSVHDKLNKDNQFKEIETAIDKLFKKLGLDKLFPSSPLVEIKLEYKQEWSQHIFDSDNIIQELLDALKFQKDELTALVN